MERSEEKKLETLSPFEVKNTLITLAGSNHDGMMLNAGRGNPNWVATIPRLGFFRLGMFAVSEAERSLKGTKGFGGHPEKEGITGRFNEFLKANAGDEGAAFLEEASSYAVKTLGIASDDLLIEMVDGILGDFYPGPDRMLKNCETIVGAYLRQELCAGCTPPEKHFDIFATEGGTAAMTYVFNTLVENKLLAPGDKIAIGTPVFTPYLEIPRLNDFSFVEVEIMADENNKWKIPDAEIDKLLDPEIKAFFVVNPSNPPSARLDKATIDRITNIIDTKRPDLILLTDDVYCTFTNGFVSLFAAAPRNTIGVYSFSKYFGATGWRLGIIALYEDNALDKAIRNLPPEKAAELKQRYASVNLDPSSMKLIDRMVADSRAVALNHTAGLSTPQQIQMALFSLYALIDKKTGYYKKTAQGIVKRRYHSLYENAAVPPLVPEDDENNSFYYTEIDILQMGEKHFGKPFTEWLVKNHEPLDFLIRLAQEKSVVLMPGGGFDAPEWSVRVSLANLPDEAYSTISLRMRELLEEYQKDFAGK